METTNTANKIILKNGHTITQTLSEEEVAEIKSWAQEEQNKKMIIEYKTWFENYFRIQLEQSLWQDDFEVSEDPYFKNEDGQSKTYKDINELKSQAKLVRDTIRSLKKN